MLSFINATKEFRLDNENTITPVKDVSLDIGEGELIVITGRSGTGKTTLLNLAAGMVKPTSGRVTLEGKDLSSMNDRQLSAMRSNTLGFVFQFPSLLPPLSVIENVSLPSVFAGKNGNNHATERAAQLLDMLGLAGRLNVYPKQLSAGEQKRVIIARSLINQPRLVLADEPTSDLDTRTEKEVMNILRNVNQTGVTFLIVTHSLELVSFATRAFDMNKGELTRIK